MQVASLELSKTLFELSGWGVLETDKAWSFHGSDYRLKDWPKGKLGVLKFPAYDAGYLLRKLPPRIVRGTNYWPQLERHINGKQYRACYHNGDSCLFLGEPSVFLADTPEDCLAMLAIELFRQGVLKEE